MSYIAQNNRHSLKHELDATKRRLQESCGRLEELLKQREEELRYWEEEHTRFREDEEARQDEKAREEDERRRAEEQWQHLFEDRLHRDQEQSSARRSTIAKAWDLYEERWQNLQTVSSGLTFQSIPWPVANAVTLPGSLTSHLISQFILSPEHSQTKSRTRRIHTALLRCHTDHFDKKVLYKVVDRDRHAVKEGVGRVVRCLNELLVAERAKMS
ncbi:hypothetical protein JB92DRAFT_3022128 [Gautieria morchelliformis]|nr:hypothetical protein JB92DRAFT_3022128 [Gautieria morchelliformis]